MKRIIGWIFTIFGGLFCYVGVMCIPAAFTAEDMSIAERTFMLIVFVGFAVINGMLCGKGIKTVIFISINYALLA